MAFFGLGLEHCLLLSFSSCLMPGDCQLGPGPAAALLSAVLGSCVCAGRLEGVRAVQGGSDAGSEDSVHLLNPYPASLILDGKAAFNFGRGEGLGDRLYDYLYFPPACSRSMANKEGGRSQQQRLQQRRRQWWQQETNGNLHRAQNPSRWKMGKAQAPSWGCLP